MTEKILQMMEERRKHKNDITTYMEIREAKQKEMEEKFHEIETLHKKVREITGKYKKRTVGKLVNDNGELIVD